MNLDVLQGFVHELRGAGLPVSMTENLDAMRGIEQIDIADREVLRSVLGATLVKQQRHRRAFDTVFEVYFSLTRSTGEDSDGTLVDELHGTPIDSMGGAGGEIDPADLANMLLRALRSMDIDELRRLAGIAIDQFAGIEPGRPVGGTYYLYRTLRQLDLDSLSAQLLDEAQERGEVPDDALHQRLAQEEFDHRVQGLRELIEEEIRRRLVADRGVEAMARTLRKPLPEDVDFMHASREDMQALQLAIHPLTRLLAARLAQRRRRRHRGHLDFRRTVRASMNYGGVPVDPKFRRPHPSKPEIMIVADISGSVASFARFTLQFVHAMASQFSRVRSWVFIDGIDEVTRYFETTDDIAEAVRRVNDEADVVWVDGHSDYGHTLAAFHQRHEREVTHKTSLIVLGDARNNYHESQNWVLESLQKRARHVYWLNPEPRSYWDTGDSIISQYARYCDGMYECRNLRQLQRFVSTVAEA